jgi:hypothetical protein
MNPDANNDLGALLMERIHGILAAHKSGELTPDKASEIDRYLESIP